MKMRLRERPEISGELGMSSMTDIIFILLIFFMMVSTLVNPSALTLTVPGNAKTTGKAVTNTRLDDIAILADGRFTLNNTLATVETIKKTLESAKIKNPAYKVSISPNPQAPVEKVVVILDMTQNMGISSTLHAEVGD